MKRLLWIIFILILLGVLAWIAWYYFENNRRENELVLFGNVDVRQVDIGFRVAGQVAELLFEEGDFVKEGQLMATLDKSPYNSQVSQAKANVESIRANLENAITLLERREDLIGPGGISQEDLDQALANRNIYEANLASAQAAEQAAADNLTYTQAYAPTDGIILTRVREPGSVVKESDPVFVLSVISPVWIRAFVTEPQLGLIYFGMPAKIYTDSSPQSPFEGRIGFISPVSEFTPKTVETTKLRTDLVYRLRIYVDNPDWSLKQGMPVTVKLEIPLHRQPEEKGE